MIHFDDFVIFLEHENGCREYWMQYRETTWDLTEAKTYSTWREANAACNRIKSIKDLKFCRVDECPEFSRLKNGTY